MKEMRNFKYSVFYHLFNKSISNFGIFHKSTHKKQLIRAMSFYNSEIKIVSLSVFLRKNKDYFPNILISGDNPIVKIISYCIMPDHYHLLIKVLIENLVSKYINDLENSFTRYFNVQTNRKGPLWQSEFKSVRIKTNEQLLHVSRYIHLNPTTKKLVKKPEEWEYSSYRNFIYDKSILHKIIKEISIHSNLRYKKFVEDRINYQQKLKVIKRLILD